MDAGSPAFPLEVARRELGDVRPEQAAAAFGEPDLAWAQGTEWLLGWGVAAEQVATTKDAPLPVLQNVFRGGLWLGGVAFDVERDPAGAWTGWPRARWVMPRLVVRTTSNAVVLELRGGQAAIDEQVQRLRSAKLSVPPSPRLSEKPADVSHWTSLHAKAFGALGRLEKVVIAREVELRGELKPFPAFLAANARFPSCRSFLLRGRESVFLGATPETLCRIRGTELETEALAGTAAPEAAEALLHSRKEHREHLAVVDDIRRALSPWTTEFNAGNTPEIVTLPNALHLRTRIHAKLREPSQAANAVMALHPTAAVNGAPRPQAMAFLREHEDLERGWYAGFVGAVEEGVGELRVALRSALLRPSGARLFAGAGIVTGSVATAEWAETERKLAAMRAVLGVMR